MLPSLDHPVPAALLRLLAARVGVSAIGIFLPHGGAWRLWAGTEALAGMLAVARGVPEFLLPLTTQTDLAVRVAPATLGLTGDFCAVQPIAGGSGDVLALMVAVDRRSRRMSPSMIAALRDGAEVLALLLAAAPRPASAQAAAEHGMSDVPLATRGAILSRAAAHRIVEAALLDPRSAAPIAVLVLDLDRFRAVNEALGTAAGDALLAVTGARLERALDPCDRLMRLEGDRFVVLAARSARDLPALARRLLDLVSQPMTLAGRCVTVQASIGIVAKIAPGQPTATVLMQADAALHRAKAEGRNRFALHEPGLDAASHDKSQLELDLVQAPGKGEMRLVYQPFVELSTGAIVGVEALLRWHHPTRGEIQPAAFIPLAEASGQILPLGTWALRTALAQAARWPDCLALSVNISALQFRQSGFAAHVDAALREAGFPADRLELEITETVLMRDRPETTHRLRALIARGVRIALDDFGTGYSALAYLARLPHHRIKLDRSFVRDLANPATFELIRAIIALARAQGIAVTAEGVERPDQLAQIRAMGFTHAQGFATGTPVADPTVLISERLDTLA